MTQAYIQTGIALAGVIGLILLMSFIMKKKQARPGMMKIMGYQQLGPKKGIAAVKVGREVLLVGVTANDLKLLRTMDDHFDENGQARETVKDISDKLKQLRTIKDTLHAVK